MFIRWRRLFLLCCLTLAACSSHLAERPSSLPLETLAAGQDGRNSAGTYESELVVDRKQLSRLWANLPRGFGLSSTPLPEVDFNRQQVLFLSLGQQPTAGYRLALAAEELTFSERTGIVRVVWQTPGPDSLQAQVLTAPYLVLRLPLAELAEIRVLDQHRQLRARVVVPR